MKMTEDEFKEHSDEMAGYCTKCKEITEYDVEPDAEGYECSQCNTHSVMGMENALILDKITITDDDEDDDGEDEDWDSENYN